MSLGDDQRPHAQGVRTDGRDQQAGHRRVADGTAGREVVGRRSGRGADDDPVAEEAARGNRRPCSSSMSRARGSGPMLTTRSFRALAVAMRCPSPPAPSSRPATGRRGGSRRPAARPRRRSSSSQRDVGQVAQRAQVHAQQRHAASGPARARPAAWCRRRPGRSTTSTAPTSRLGGRTMPAATTAARSVVGHQASRSAPAQSAAIVATAARQVVLGRDCRRGRPCVDRPIVPRSRWRRATIASASGGALGPRSRPSAASTQRADAGRPARRASRPMSASSSAPRGMLLEAIGNAQQFDLRTRRPPGSRRPLQHRGAEAAGDAVLLDGHDQAVPVPDVRQQRPRPAA